MISWLENRINAFALGPDTAPPPRLRSFYAHYVRQVWPVFVIILLTGTVAAVAEMALFTFLGQLVDLARSSGTPAAFMAEHGVMLLLMAVVAALIRPVAFMLHGALIGMGVAPSFTNLVRWQTHRYVLRQSLGFFQNDFAGRIAAKVMQTGPALRESVVQITDAIWFMTVYTVGTAALFLETDVRLAIPLAFWVICYLATLGWFVPKIQRRAVITSEARSTLTGRIVDSYTNIATVKLFAHTDREDGYARDAIADHLAAFRAQTRLLAALQVFLNLNNGILIVGTTGLALSLWGAGAVTVGAIAVTTGLVIRLNNMSGWIMWVMIELFDNIGVVQEGMETIARPYAITDAPGAPDLRVSRGEIRYEGVRFHYGREAGVIEDLSLAIRPGEKVGLVGRSGAGKSTLVNLLLRFHDLEGGRILIDGQDIAGVTQDSLRAQIGVVTQDTSLLHRSIRDNILYGRPDASEAEVWAAIRQAHADSFVDSLEDQRGRRGLDAHVGERGVKLSGGQRQRIAIARVLLKNAPILVLDEATSALDSEVEAAIQEQLGNLMRGKSVIAIAHRLSTIAAMDRLIVLDRGHIVEEGRHEALVRRNGIYAELWRRQSGGFLLAETAA